MSFGDDTLDPANAPLLPRMAFFGKRYDAPLYNGAPEISVPVDEACIWCNRRFRPGDDGLQYVSGEYTHRTCNLRNVLGADLLAALEEEGLV